MTTAKQPMARLDAEKPRTLTADAMQAVKDSLSETPRPIVCFRCGEQFPTVEAAARHQFLYCFWPADNFPYPGKSPLTR